jgi:hypothetical protein
MFVDEARQFAGLQLYEGLKSASCSDICPDLSYNSSQKSTNIASGKRRFGWVGALPLRHSTSATTGCSTTRPNPSAIFASAFAMSPSEDADSCAERMSSATHNLTYSCSPIAKPLP